MTITGGEEQEWEESTQAIGNTVTITKHTQKE